MLPSYLAKPLASSYLAARLFARNIAEHGSLVTTQRYLHPDAQSIADVGMALSAPGS
jgi:hypothetical protein